MLQTFIQDYIANCSHITCCYVLQEEEEEEEEEEELEEDANDRMRNELNDVYDNDTNKLAAVTVSSD